MQFRRVRKFGSGFLKGFGKTNIKMGNAMVNISPYISVGSALGGQPEGIVLGEAIGLAGQASIAVGEGALALRKGNLSEVESRAKETETNLKGIDKLYS